MPGRARRSQASTPRAAMMRNSERAAVKRCPQAWWWRWREGLVPAGHLKDPLWFGTGWHLVMAYWYCGPGLKRGADPLRVWEDWIKDEVRFLRTSPYVGAQYKQDEYVEAGELGRAMLENYFNTYGDDPDWFMIAPEQTFQVRIRCNIPGEYVINCGTFDGVYRSVESGKPRLVEHKTAKAIQTGHLPLDDQGGNYWAVATTTLRDQKLIGPRESIEGIMYSFARKAKPDERPVNARGFHTNKPKKEHYIAAIEAQLREQPWCGPKEGLSGKESLELLGDIASKMELTVLGDESANQPAPYFKREMIYRTTRERNQQITRIGQEAEVMHAFKTGAIPLYKTPTKDCKGGCDFYDLCVVHETSTPEATEEYKRLGFRIEDPYKDHRKSAAAD